MISLRLDHRDLFTLAKLSITQDTDLYLIYKFTIQWPVRAIHLESSLYSIQPTGKDLWMIWS